jgi:hypothetical protein
MSIDNTTVIDVFGFIVSNPEQLLRKKLIIIVFDLIQLETFFFVKYETTAKQVARAARN